MPEEQLSYAGAVNEDRSPLFTYAELTDILGASFASQEERNMLRLVAPRLDTMHDIDQFSGQIFLAYDDYPDCTREYCSPSRTSFMTGRYPYHIGQQTGMNLNPTPGIACGINTAVTSATVV